MVVSGTPLPTACGHDMNDVRSMPAPNHPATLPPSTIKSPIATDLQVSASAEDLVVRGGHDTDPEVVILHTAGWHERMSSHPSFKFAQLSRSPTEVARLAVAPAHRLKLVKK